MADRNISINLPGNTRQVISSRGAYPSPEGEQFFSDALVSDAEVYTEVSSGVKRRKPLGWMPPTGYSLSTVHYQRARGSVINKGMPLYGWSRTTGTVDSWNSLNHFNEIGAEGVLTEDASALRDRALITALAALKGKNVDLGVAFAERKQTAEFVSDTIGSIVSSVRNLKRGRVRKAMADLGLTHKAREPRGSNWPRKWLELQYAARPLYSDIYGSVVALSKRDAGDWRVTAKGSASKEISRTRPPSGGGNVGEYYGTLNGSLGVRVRIDALPSAGPLAAARSVGLTNPALIAWELVPFSFVVDWALPIGDYLNSLDAYLGFDSWYIVTSVRSEGIWVGTGRSPFPTATPDRNGIENNFREYKRIFSLSRTVSTEKLLPVMPRFKDPTSLSHLATSLSLLTQVFGKGRISNYVKN